jgi:2-oxoglutarate dehydrogenase complex dehydrogenase (E1) component-like enzyme
LKTAYEDSRKHKFNKAEWIARPWEELMKPTKWGLPHQTGVDQKEIIALVKKINSWPNDFNVHP